MSTTKMLHWVLLALTATTLYLCWPLWPALVLAAWTAALARPLLNRLQRFMRGRRRAAAVLALGLFLVVSVPMALLTVAVIIGSQELAQGIGKASSAKVALAAIATGTEGVPPLVVPRSLQEAMDLLRAYGEQGLSVLSNVAGAAATGMVGLFIYLGGSFVFLVDGPAIWGWMKDNNPLAPSHLQRLSTAFHETGRGLIVGVGLTCVAQGLVATIIYVSLGVPRWWVLGPLTGLASILPMVGTTLVWGPIVLGFFLTSHPIKAVILSVLGVGVIGSVDNLLRPVFAKFGALKLPTFFLFVSIFGGLAAFGTWGALLGPLVVRCWLEVVAIYRQGDSTPAAPPSSEPQNT
ncbi:MAG: AI-2E family transporter [Deltaproteobacteria bacterium]|nr:AI-2E family transporter [Deltaproteobacteria bacterium]